MAEHQGSQEDTPRPARSRPLIHHLAGVSVVSSPQEDQDLGVRGPGFQGGAGEKTCCSSLSPAWPPPQLRPHSASVGAASAKQREKNRRDRPSEARAPLPALVQPGRLTTSVKKAPIRGCLQTNLGVCRERTIRSAGQGHSTSTSSPLYPVSRGFREMVMGPTGQT